MTIGEKIKELRKDNLWTRGQLAYKAKVHENSIFLWERGSCEPNIQSCIALADVFGVTLDELCRGD
jgi:DNA-binding XRE family transcriptional regulator